ncbi:MAG: DUF1588 domain-containing protein [Planctomycetota bacterium]
MVLPYAKTVIAALLLVGIAEIASADEMTAVRALFAQTCLDCHAADDPEAGLNLEDAHFDLDDRGNFAMWSRVLERTRLGEMPPADYGPPDADVRDAAVKHLTDALTNHERSRIRQYGRRELRRLSRVEFAQSLRDILRMPHLDILHQLPPDGREEGFAKSARALDFSHVMISRYSGVAEMALRQALAPTLQPQPKQTIVADLSGIEGVTSTLQTLRVQLKQTTGIPLVGMQPDPTFRSVKGNFEKRDPGNIFDPPPHLDGVATFMHSRANHNIVIKPFKVRQSGTYELRVHGWSLINDHGQILPSPFTETIGFYAPSGRLLGRVDLGPGNPDAGKIDVGETTVWLESGGAVEYMAVSLPNRWFQLGGKIPRPHYKQFHARGIGLRRFEMEGPLESQWPLPSHHVLLGDLPLKPAEENPGELPYEVDVDALDDGPIQVANQMLRRFARRAIRRPLQAGDLDVAMQTLHDRLNAGDSFIESLLAGYRVVLTSPAFLLMPENTGRLDAAALASRLSFFLTNSPPDSQLLKAVSGDHLKTQTERLLDDPKAARFIEHFLDDWLDLRRIRDTEPDENLYPEHNALLTESMIEETRAYFAELLRTNAPISALVDSDSVMINQRLAELYQRDSPQSHFRDVKGSKIRKVKLPEDSPRGGLLTQASILKLTANGTTTSPIVRGVFVMERLLGDPPPPPPASVPAVESDISGAKTIRELLAKHRSDAACATCHRKIDPPGFALEAFDVMGGYRDRYRASRGGGKPGDRVHLKHNGKPVAYRLAANVDASGAMPRQAGNSDDSGAGDPAADIPFADIHEFRDIMLTRQRQMARNLLHRLVMYSTGHRVGYAERSTIDGILDRLAESGYPIRDMIHEVVQSDLFRCK